MDILCFLSPIVFINSGMIFVFQLSFHLSNSILNGFTHSYFYSQLLSTINIQDSMFPCTNGTRGHWLVHIPLKYHLERIPAGWPSGHSKSSFPSCHCQWKLSPPLSHAVASGSPFLSLALASHPLIRIFIKLNLKLPPIYLINVYFFLTRRREILVVCCLY